MDLDLTRFQLDLAGFYWILLNLTGFDWISTAFSFTATIYFVLHEDSPSFDLAKVLKC